LRDEMAKQDAPRITLDDADGWRLHAVWSRSGKRLGVSVSTVTWRDIQQMELRREQVQELIDFLVETLAAPPSSA
jgi:hypothetical protein